MLKSLITRFSTLSNNIIPKICIVGAGPAGFYAAQHLAKKLQTAQIDIIERFPVPFGLVRFGVAPDHPEVKNVINTFTKTAESPNVNFYGNIELGQDISLDILKQNYHIVLLTYGAEENRQLNILGEDLNNVIPARKIVGWYNGIPTDKNLEIDLDVETVAIIGQGNVAVDVARILLSPIDQLKKTDITQHALEQLSKSRLKRVYLVGRRGPLQAAFTIKELREMLKLENCNTEWREEDFNEITEKVVKNLGRPKKRITELMLSSVKGQKNAEKSKGFHPIFFRSPLRVLGKSSVEKLELGINRLENDRAILTDHIETLDCNLLISSIGYKSVQADPDIPFDSHKGTVKNIHGKVAKGLYTSGWLGTGPVGVILTTMSNAFGVAEAIIEDIQKEQLIVENKPGFEAIKDSLKVQIVNWNDWQKINQYEEEQGRKLGKPREKLVDIDKMLSLL